MSAFWREESAHRRLTKVDRTTGLWSGFLLMIFALAFDALLVAACGYAFLRGDRDSRMIALICTVASLISHLLLRANPERYSTVEAGVMAVDVMTFAGFTMVALASPRFCPLWIAGLQLTTLLAHFSKEVEIDLVPRAYAVAAVFWSYPILLILAVGTWRAHRRQLAER